MRLATIPGEMARHGFWNVEASSALFERIQSVAEPDRPSLITLEMLAATPDPDLAVAALAHLAEYAPERFLHAVGDADRARRLVAVLGGSVALGQHLRSRPADLSVLAQEPVRRPAEAIVADVAAAIGLGSDADPFDLDGQVAQAPEAADRLRLENRRQLVRIAARDLTSEDPWEFESIAAELADLADAVMRAALAIARAQVPDHADARIAIIGLGKCGARELNYISDVDVLYVAEPANEAISNDRAVAVAAKLAAASTRICSAHTGAGSIWQVDAALRPEGRAGPLVRTLPSMAKYYTTWAKNWEFQAMLKARPMAGDADLGRRFCELVSPMVWQAAERAGFVADSQAMRQRVISLIPAGQSDREIKLGAGGLRDVEFSVQLLELVHGRADERLREPATMPGLRSLVAHGYIGRADGEELAQCYRFMRTLEHRVQLFKLRRTHLLPDDPAELSRLARGLGMTAEELLGQWRATRRTVQRLHQRVFYSPLLEAVARLSSDQIRLSTDAARTRLKALGFVDPAAALRHLEALTQGMSRQAEIQRQLLPAMLGWFAEGPNPDNGLLSFRRICEALATTPWYLRVLRDEGEVAQRLARVLSSSRYVVDLLLRNPSSVQLLVDESGLVPRDRSDLIKGMITLINRHEDAGTAAAAIRAMRGRELLRLAIGDIVGTIDQDALGVGLSDLTSATVEAALMIADRSAGFPSQLGVLAMGRWGGRENGYSSDADAMFVIIESDPESIRNATAVVASMRKLLTAAGPDPALDLDPDLRPEGKGGPMVRSLASYEAYYERWSSTWEAQALVRAGHGAGDPDVVDALLRVIDPVRYPVDGVGPVQVAEIRKLKGRMEKERVPRGMDRGRNLKLGPGGLSDVEWTVQLLQLRHAAAHPELRTTSTMEALHAARELELISAADSEALEHAWRMASRIRNTGMLVRGRASDAIPTDARDVAAVAWLMGYHQAEASKLLDDYQRCTRRASKVVDRMFWGL